MIASEADQTLPPSRVRFLPTKRLERSPHGARLLRVAQEVSSHFPELARAVRLDVLPSSSRVRGLAFPLERPPRVAVRPHTRTPVALQATLAHELVHLLQPPLGTVPGGERSCDLYALARVGDLFPHPPFYLRLPREAAREWGRWAPVARELAQKAWARRASGERRYIVAWERAFRERTRASPPGTAISEGGAGPAPSGQYIYRA